MIYIAIDAGKSGAWGVVETNGGFVGCGNMPMFEDGTIIARSLWSEISAAIGDGAAPSEIVCGIEYVNSHDMGRQTAFVFGRATGIQNAVLQVLGGKPIEIRPQQWKKHHSLIGSEKAASTKLARQKWGAVVKNNGQAEALLIADYMRQIDELKGFNAGYA